MTPELGYVLAGLAAVFLLVERRFERPRRFLKWIGVCDEKTS